MVSERYLEDANLISKDELLEHVSLSVLRNASAAIPFITDWSKGGVKKEPLEILDIKLVCYSYPKLGVMFEMIDEQGRQSRLIFDVADLSLIPEKPPKPGVEGAYAWSFYDST